MIELLKFTLESFYNFAGTLFFLVIILFFMTTAITGFKPISYSYVTQVKETKEKEG